MSDSFIPISKPCIGAREKELVLDALDSGRVSSIGKYIDEFEANFARYCRANLSSRLTPNIALTLYVKIAKLPCE
jgi:dTDP-4-amino-4,6-dideoxygalactose transaminase